MHLQIAVKPSVLCCHPADTNEELGGLATVIPPFAKLLRSLLLVLCKQETFRKSRRDSEPGRGKAASATVYSDLVAAIADYRITDSSR